MLARCPSLIVCLAVGHLSCSAPAVPCPATRLHASSPQAPATTLPPATPAASSAPVPVPSPALQHAAEAVVHAFSIEAPTWSPDQRRLLFISDRKGQPAAWLSLWSALDLPPDLVGAPDWNTLAALFLPGNTEALVAVATTDQSCTLWRTNLTANQPSRLATIDDCTIDRIVQARGAPDAVAFIAHRTLAPHDTLYSLRPAASSPRPVADLPPGTRLLDVSPAGTHALLGLADRGTLVEIDLVNGAKDEVTTQGTLTSACYGRDGKQIWTATSRGDEACLDSIRAGTGASPTSCFTSCRIRDLRAAARGSRLAALVDCQEGSVLRILETSNLAHHLTAALPTGTGTLADFSRNGTAVLVTWQTPSSPPDIFAVDARSGTVRQLRKDVRPTLAALDDMASRIVDVPSNGVTSKVVVHAPATAWSGRSHNHPVVMLLTAGTVAERMRWSPLVRLLVARGAAVVAASVDQFKTPEAVSLLLASIPNMPWADRSHAAVVGFDALAGLAFRVRRTAPATWRAAVALRSAPPDSATPTPPVEPMELDIALDDSTQWYRVHGSAPLAQVVAFIEQRLQEHGADF